MITQYIRENELLIGSTQRVNFNIPLRLLKMGDLLRYQINPRMTRTEFIETLFLQFVTENWESANQIMELNELQLEELEWMTK